VAHGEKLRPPESDRKQESEARQDRMVNWTRICGDRVAHCVEKPQLPESSKDYFIQGVRIGEKNKAESAVIMWCMMNKP
jgi:hypothetical protein